MVIKQFYRPDRRYWYKLIILGGIFYIIYDYRESAVGKRIALKDYNKGYLYTNIDEALKTFNAWEKEYS